MTARDVFCRPLSHWIVAALFIAIVPFVACLGE